jgi:hypothetical protein
MGAACLNTRQAVAGQLTLEAMVIHLFKKRLTSQPAYLMR